MVDGADYFLLCHDDVALFPDAVHLLVEEAFRSNAGIVSPKVVSWDDPERLVHVGMTVDKGGSVVDRVQPNEIDHGQHDAVRDVFVAPGGCTLVRADLFEELGGFDPAIVAMGEDLDLCWRAQVVGARIIVAPDARVRHLEELAAGTPRPRTGLVGGGRVHSRTAIRSPSRSSSAATSSSPCSSATDGSTCSGWCPRCSCSPLGGGRRRRAGRQSGPGPGSGAGVAVEPRSTRDHPSATQTSCERPRRLGDKEIRLLQVGGSARLSSYARRVFQHGFAGAHADELAAAADRGPAPLVTAAAIGSRPRDGRRPVPGPGRRQLSGRTRLVAWLVAALVVVIGSAGGPDGPPAGDRTVHPLPELVGHLRPVLRRVASLRCGDHRAGRARRSPSPGLVGTVLLGAMGLTQKVLVFGCLPLGVWGVVRLLRPFGSQRASLVAGPGLPRHGASLRRARPRSMGRAGALRRGCPGCWRASSPATGIGPFGRPRAGATVRPERRVGCAGADPVHRPSMLGPRACSRRCWSPSCPPPPFVVVLAAVALVLSSSLFGDVATDRPRTRARCGIDRGRRGDLPALGDRRAVGRDAVRWPCSGRRSRRRARPSWGSLLRFAVGPIGDSPLAWGFVVAGAGARSCSPAASGSAGPCGFWSIAVLVFWLVAWVIGRGLDGAAGHRPAGPAGTGRGRRSRRPSGWAVAAFEEDLRAADFGWRQLATVVAAGAVALGALPDPVSRRSPAAGTSRSTTSASR